MTKERSRSLLALAGFGLATAGAAWFGARYSRKGSRDSWYRDLDKPSFTPPDAVFPVTSRKLLMLIPARRTPVGASSATIWLII